MTIPQSLRVPLRIGEHFDGGSYVVADDGNTMGETPCALTPAVASGMRRDVAEWFVAMVVHPGESKQVRTERRVEQEQAMDGRGR